MFCAARCVTQLYACSVQHGVSLSCMHVLCSTVCHSAVCMFSAARCVTQLYACSVQHGVSLLFANVCYFMFTRLMFVTFFFIFCFVCFLLYLIYVYVSSFVLFSVLFILLFCTFPFLYNLPTSVTGWKINCSKYISYHIISYHIIYHVI